MIIRYREINGQVVRDIVHRTRHTGEARPVPFHENLLRTHYMLECRDGSRYRSAYPKSVTKRVLEGAMARKDNL
jgi:hypothetical protein